MNDNKHTFQITSSWVNLLREHSRNAIFPFVVHYSDKTCVSSLGSISQSLNHIWTLTTLQVQLTFYPYPPASKASREVAKITVRKNLYNPFKWCQRICVSLCLFVCNKLWSQLLIFHLNRTKNHLKKVCRFGCASCFCKLIFGAKQMDNKLF